MVTTEWLGESSLITFDDFRRDKQWHQWILLWADRHWDNPGTNQEFMLEELELLKERNGILIDVGDFFCAMQGKYDKRSSKESIRPEHQTSQYLDALVDSATDFLAPYAKHIAQMSPGNHETSIADRHETYLTQRLVSKLRDLGSQTLLHKYNGFTRYRFVASNNNHDNVFSLVQWHTHGYGGGGPVTKDVIQMNRQGVFLDNVDLVISGHTHDAWVVPQATMRLTKGGSIEHRERLHLKIPSMKRKIGTNSWEDQKGHPPKPVGSYWLKINFSAHSGTKRGELRFDAQRSRP